jgi:hypothetical protein
MLISQITVHKLPFATCLSFVPGKEGSVESWHPTEVVTDEVK